MTLRERIEQDFRQAMRAHDVARLGTLRVLKAAIERAVIAARTSARQELDDAAVAAVVQQEVKKLRDALADFTRAVRQDLVSATEREIAVLSAYLPQGLSSGELAAIARDVVAALRAQGPTEFGRAMGAVMKEVKGRSPGETVAEAVRTALEAAGKS
jgi:hypothetical protein